MYVPDSFCSGLVSGGPGPVGCCVGWSYNTLSIKREKEMYPFIISYLMAKGNDNLSLRA